MRGEQREREGGREIDIGREVNGDSGSWAYGTIGQISCRWKLTLRSER